MSNQQNPENSRKPYSAISDKEQFRELTATQFQAALSSLMTQFPQIRSLALIVDWDESLPVAVPLVWQTKPGCNSLYDMTRILKRSSEANLLMLKTIERHLKGDGRGEAESDGAGVRDGGLHPPGVGKRDPVQPQGGIREDQTQADGHA